MKKVFITLLTFVSGIILVTNLVLARTFPSPTGFVNDFADIISPQVELDLENQLRAFEASASHELTVVTLASLEDDVIENTAVKLFEQWEIGKKNQDNGVLLLIVPNERQLKIEVGYGLEPILTDSRAGTIIRTVITPEFKNNNYDAGIVNGVTAIKQVLIEDPTAFDAPPASTSKPEDIAPPLIILFAFILVIYATAFLGRSKHFWPGGVIGGLGGFFAGSAISTNWAITAAVGLGIWGLLLDYLVSKNYKVRKTKGLPTSWWSSGGGFSSKSGGGFGGFGGGSSGGGGASGSW